MQLGLVALKKSQAPPQVIHLTKQRLGYLADSILALLYPLVNQVRSGHKITRTDLSFSN